MKYYIESWHEIYQDNFKEGEVAHVNSYSMSAMIEADSIKEALAKYYEKILLYDFYPAAVVIDDCRFTDATNLNENGEEPSESELQDFRDGIIDLLIDYFVIEVSELHKLCAKEGMLNDA